MFTDNVHLYARIHTPPYTLTHTLTHTPTHLFFFFTQKPPLEKISPNISQMFLTHLICKRKSTMHSTTVYWPFQSARSRILHSVLQSLLSLSFPLPLSPWYRVLLCRPDWPGTHTHSLAYTSWAPWLKVMTRMVNPFELI